MIAIICFVTTVLATLVITAWAGRRTSQRADFYAAGSRITGTQNGLAIAGDFMSATTVLGIAGLYFASGWDVAIYYLAPLAGLCLMLLLIAGPLRRLGQFTLGDVMVSRLADDRLRVFAGLSTIAVSLVYLVAQMVGAGTLISLLFGLTFEWSVILVGGLMALYIAVGGMLAATWVQIIKAVLLMIGVGILGVFCLVEAGGLGGLYERTAAVSDTAAALFQPGGFKASVFSNLSLGLGMVFGLLGMPHLLIRFFTVPDEKQARRSVAVASVVIGGVFAILFLIANPATVAFVKDNPAFQDASGALRGGGNMVTVHLANAVGGEWLQGLIAAVAFATILAVVAGLTIASASAASHDLFRIVRKGRTTEGSELWVFRAAAIGVALVAISIAIVFQKENVAFLTALAFAVAASANFPLLILVLYWRPLTTAGALAGGITGLVASVALIVASPAVWVKALGNPEPLFPADYPTLVTAPLAFAVCMIVSLMTRRAVAR
ncbi:sodium:solute symporter family transporter [Phenylobacterium sp.]|jgi:cation/acetate symporter|uniref:sodium:solute symporter family transporter n=1 Tax=Phenylobacterium sp. TaxID=1871053 RepID=UPI003784E4C4